jgi:hypothetical protein
MTSGRKTVARTRTQGRQDAATSRRGRFARGSTDQAQSPRRFPRKRRRHAEVSGAQKLMQEIRDMLPGGGKSSTGRRSRGGAKKGEPGRGRKPAMFGLLGAGAAGAAAAVAKRRHGSRSSQPAGETTDVSEAQATPTAATTPPDPDTPTADDAR